MIAYIPGTGRYEERPAGLIYTKNITMLFQVQLVVRMYIISA